MPKPERKMMKQRLSTYLRQLEAESIHIMREVAAEFRNPVMLYSIGKDSSVMLHLALKAFYPAKPPFPLLHVDTTWKFREMIAFRDQTPQAARARADRAHQPRTGVKRGIIAVHHGSRAAYRHHEDRGAAARRSTSTASTRPSAARGATRRNRAPRSASSRSATPRTPGIRSNQRPELWHLFNTRIKPGESMRVFPLSNWTELDVWQYIHARGYSGRAALFRQGRGRSSSATAC